MIKRLKYYFHKLILHGYELFQLRVTVAIIGLAIVCLGVALIIPCVHHLRDFSEEV
jgi:mannitol-specific phosphotransferase system IIBC component